MSNFVKADDPPGKVSQTDIFSFNKISVENQLSDLATLELALKSGNSDAVDSIMNQSEGKIVKAVLPENRQQTATPGKFPSFLWSFLWSAAGTYTIYGAVAGPISVLIVYLASDRDKKEVRRALWGWVTGTVVGLGLWLYIRSLRV